MADFPYFFDGSTDIVLGSQSLLELGAGMRRTLSSFQIDAQVRHSEQPGEDLIFLGLFDDAVQAERHLTQVGIRVGETLRTPFSPDLDPQGSAIISLQSQDDRHILIVLAETVDTLRDAIARLESGEFRDVIVSEMLGVIVPEN